MKLRILQALPGTIGGLPAGENFVAGSDYDVPDDVAVTMKREGWAVDAPPPAAQLPRSALRDREEPVT